MHKVLDLDISDEVTEEISDWFILCEEDKDRWESGDYLGADKP